MIAPLLATIFSSKDSFDNKFPTWDYLISVSTNKSPTVVTKDQLQTAGLLNPEWQKY